MNTAQTTLYSYRAEGLALKEAIAACQQQLLDAIALLYSPQSCQLMRLENGEFKDCKSNLIDDWNIVFEARVFTEMCELRWLNCMDGNGDAVLLSETQQTIEGFLELPPQSCESLQQEYLLWGEKARTQPAHETWQRLAEARIGKLDIPLNERLEESQRVYLRTLEYLTTVDQFGNFAVIEERLLKLVANG